MTSSSLIYVIDTCAIMDDPKIYETLPESDIYIPIVVLEELDKNKKSPDGQRSYKARQAIKHLALLSKETGLHTGIYLENTNSIVYVDLEKALPVPGLDAHHYTNDLNILSRAYHIAKENPNSKTVLVSNDLNMLVRAKSLGMEILHPSDERKSEFELYKGFKEIVDPYAGYELRTTKQIQDEDFDLGLNINECVLFTDEQQNGLAIGRKVNDKTIVSIKSKEAYGIKPQNVEQTFLLDMLMDSDIQLVSCTGIAGSGKTILSLSAGLQQVIEEKKYDKLMLYKSIQSVGNELGFLPGDLNEKLSPYNQSYFDNLEILLGSDKHDKRNDWKSKFEMLKTRGQVTVEAVSFIRGRSINNAFIIIDEVQNLTKDDVKTICSRLGVGSKIVLLGDIEQIDSPKLDKENNGLTYLVEKLKNQLHVGHITLKEGKRSYISQLVAQLM